MTDLQRDNFTEDYVRHLEELLEVYTAYFLATEKLLTENQIRRTR